MRWPTRALLLLLAFSPAVLSAGIAARYAVEVPIWDDLERATLLQRWNDGTLDWHYVYSPHIEHRMGVPRLITLASASLGDGSLLTEQVIIFGIVVLTALLVHGLLLRTFPARPGAVYGLTFLANVLLFSPLQWETFLFSIQTTFVIPPFGLCLVLLTLRSRRGPALKFALCFLAAVLASNSFSHGVVLWGVVFAIVALQRSFAPARVRSAFLAAWLVASAAVLVPHFTVDGYANTSNFSYVEIGERAPGLQLRSLPSRLPKAAAFASAVLGSPLARTTVLDPRDVVPWTATALLGLFGAAIFGVLRRWRDRELWDRCLPWLAMGGYAAVTCIAVGIGRSALNKWSYGLVPHYITVSTYLVLADAVLTGVLAGDLLRHTAWPFLRAALPRALAVAAGGLLTFQALQWGIGVAGMHEWKSARLQSRTDMLYLNQFPPKFVRRVGGDLEEASTMVNRLNDVGYLVPPMLKDTSLCHFALADAPLDPAEARLASVRLTQSEVLVSGWAWISAAGRRADGVLLSVRDADGRPRVVALVELNEVPYTAVPESDYRFGGVHLPGLETFAGFRGKVPLARLNGASEIRAWAVDSERMRVHPFAQQVVLHANEAGRSAELRPAPAIGGAACRDTHPPSSDDDA